MASTKVVLLASLVFTAGTCLAENSPTAGGGGGQPASVECVAGRVMIGVKLKSANYMDRVVGVCAELSEVLMPADTSDSDPFGGTGGTDRPPQMCPSGWAVRGLRTRSGSYVDNLKIRCGRIKTDGTVSGTRTHPLWAGSGAGGTTTNLNCPGGLPANGVRGRTAQWIDRIGLKCQGATVPAGTPDPNRPDLRVAIRDYPSIVTSNARITWRVELWNVGGAPATNATVDIVVPGGAPAFDQDPSFAIPLTCTPNATGARCTVNGAIGAHRRAVVRVSARPEGGGVDVEVSATADKPGQIAESNETNNTDTQTLRRVLTQ